MLISKITINELREIDSIQININDNLIAYINNRGEPNPNGNGSPFVSVKKAQIFIKDINVEFCI